MIKEVFASLLYNIYIEAAILYRVKFIEYKVAYVQENLSRMTLVENYNLVHYNGVSKSLRYFY